MVTAHTAEAPAATGGNPETAIAPSPAHVPNAVSSSWNISQETLRANLSHNTEEAREAFIWCFLWCTDPTHPMTVDEFAIEINADKTTVQRHMQGTYKHPENKTRLPISPGILKALQRFRRLQTDRALVKETGFVATPTTRKIWTACDLARESRSPVFVIGPSHIGKTCALEKYAKENNHGRTVYVRLKAASGLNGMVRAIAKEIGGIGLKANTATLVESIKANLTPTMVLILDEVHELIYTYRKESFFACIEVIREIYDHAQCGVVLCATQLLMKRIDDNRGELEQLLRRGVHKCILDPQPSRGDVGAFLNSVGLPFPDRKLTVTVTLGGMTISDQPYEMLKQLGKTEGIKSICERLRYGQKFAATEKTKVTWEHVVRAHFAIKQSATPNLNDWA